MHENEVDLIIIGADRNNPDAIAQRDDILAVYQVEELQMPDDESVTLPVERVGGREIAENVTKVNADMVWELGYTGEDVLVALIDTGVRLDHADLP